MNDGATVDVVDVPAKPAAATEPVLVVNDRRRFRSLADALDAGREAVSEAVATGSEAPAVVEPKPTPEDWRARFAREGYRSFQEGHVIRDHEGMGYVVTHPGKFGARVDGVTLRREIPKIRGKAAQKALKRQRRRLRAALDHEVRRDLSAGN